jgi:hypothetical protein
MSLVETLPVVDALLPGTSRLYLFMYEFSSRIVPNALIEVVR